MKIIDAHQHFWQLDLPFDTAWLRTESHRKICRDFLPADLQPRLKQCGVDQSLFVQTQHNLDENRWALSLCEHYDFLAGVVGWVDLASPECESQVVEFKAHPQFRGVRHIVQGETDPDFIIRPEIIKGLQVLERHQLPYDLLFFAKHLKHAETVARQVPDLPLVIDHLSKPQIKLHAMDNWLPHLRKAASCPNVYCKLSGMVTEADWDHWTPADLQPYVDQVVELFGPERCMFGSDWPVCELAGTYSQVYSALRTCLSGLSDSEQAQIFGGTAQRFYNLPSA